jgi:hypothetical protein
MKKIFNTTKAKRSQEKHSAFSNLFTRKGLHPLIFLFAYLQRQKQTLLSKKLMVMTIIGLIVQGTIMPICAQTQVIAPALTSNSVDNATPIYRSSDVSGWNHSRSILLYTEAELSAAGIVAGSTITGLSFYKATTHTLAGANQFSYELYMRNSSATQLSTSLTWATAVTNSGASLVYSNTETASTIPNTAGWWDITLDDPFVYTGGALEIATAWAFVSGGSPFSTGMFTWGYTERTIGVDFRAMGWSNNAPYAGSVINGGPQNRSYALRLFTAPAPFDPCAAIPNISACGASVSTTWTLNENGLWSPIVSNCGWTTPGQERIWTFTPTASGIHQLNITAISGGSVNLFFKASSGGCANSGWTCMAPSTMVNSTGTWGSMNLTAGVEYYIMIDPMHTNNGSLTFNVNCPAFEVEVVNAHASSNGFYTTLKAAFDAINAETQPANDIEVRIHGSTNETASAALNEGAWASLTIYPTSAGLSVSGDLVAPLIDLNGADRVTVDGRVNKTGNTASLIIENERVASVSPDHPCALRFVNSAQNNTITYCTLKGSSTNSTFGGVVIFSTASSGTGNNNNTISNCNITNSNNNRPFNGILSHGSSGFENQNNIIINNNIFDNFNTASITSTFGVYLLRYSRGFEIKNNSFYETTSLMFTQGTTIAAIHIGGSSAGVDIPDCIVEGNYIGGSAPLSAGTAMTFTTDATDRQIAFYGIRFQRTNFDNESEITNNTIKNIDIQRTTSTVAFRGIDVGASAWVSTISDNIIGEETGTGSIKINHSHTLSPISRGINFTMHNQAGKDAEISNNKIGSIVTSASNSPADRVHSFIGITSGSGATNNTLTIEGNLIGSLTTNNSIHCTNVSESGTQNLIGIEQQKSGNVIINNNTIANLTNAAQGPASNSLSRTIGIFDWALTQETTISNNTIFNLKCAARSYNNSFPHFSLIGISFRGSNNASSGGQNVFGNTIYNLENTFNGVAPVRVQGICFQGPRNDRTSNINNNFVHSLSIHENNTSADAEIIGIHIDNETSQSNASTIRNVYNNVVSLGTDVSSTPNIYGIYESNSALRTNNFYFNTVYIGGTASGHANSSPNACFFINSGGAGTVKNIRNNIMMNARTATGASEHFVCIHLAGNLDATTIDYNNYWFTGTGGALARMGTSPTGNFTTIAGWQSELNTRAGVSGKDANSLNSNPLFASAGGTNATDYKGTEFFAGTPIAGITTDFEGTIRQTPPAMGAFEIENLSVLPVELEYFVGDCNKEKIVKLDWRTASELNAYHFLVERSFDGNDWTKIGWVQAQGTTSNATSYSFEDERMPKDQIGYYRLVQVDYDGAFEIFGPIAIVCDQSDKSDKLEIYPNPSADLTNVVFTWPISAAKVTIQLIDMTGKTVWVETLSMNEGINSIPVQLEDFKKGVYQIVILLPNQEIIRGKIVKN